MKRISYILLMALAAGAVVSCEEKKKSNIIIAPKPVVKVVKTTQRMSNYEQSRNIEWLGTTYQVVVKRESADDLPLLAVDENTKYYDNKITVRVLRKDGSEFFNRTFTKKDFANYLDKSSLEHGALLGVVYFKTEGNNLCFAASVGNPDVTSDDFVPLVVKLSKMGSISIAKDQNLDTDVENENSSATSSSTSSADEMDEDDEGV